MENKKNNKKIILIIIVVIGILLMVVGFFLNINNNEEPKKDSNNEINEEKLANSILKNLNINDYLRYVFNPNVEINKNILDVKSNQNMVLYFYANDNLTKYKLTAYDTGITYSIVKYSEYVNEYKRVFDANPSTETNYDKGASFVFGVSNLPENIDCNFQVSTSETVGCDFSKPSNCFVMLTQENENSNDVEFSKLSIKGSTISGDIRLFLNGRDSGIYLDGTFEFEYEKDGDNYLAKSLKITSVANAYNSN